MLEPSVEKAVLKEQPIPVRVDKIADLTLKLGESLTELYVRLLPYRISKASIRSNEEQMKQGGICDFEMKLAEIDDTLKRMIEISKEVYSELQL